ncbi:MAG: hypothetical protein ABI162_03935 [Luteolibacter sp.]
MNLRYFTMIGSLSALAVGGVLLAPGQVAAQEREEQGVEELTRGPVHEAFATTVNFDPEPGIFVKTAPPTLIEEAPPDERPEGDNVTWIPGYWGWDDDQDDFIWISGVWRNLPPGRQWVPGYWSEVGNQWQWTSGYWANAETEEVSYLPEPPKSIESGPNVEAPSSNHIWISGTWIQRNERYAWRPGYWELGQRDWTWIPAHYQWTRRGYVFIDGYWDYDVPRRGVVFAPVHFHHDYYSRPDYVYTPLMVISLNVFVDHLFVRPHYNHYYFGDYYEPRYRESGFYTSFSYRTGRSGYDPIYAQMRWEHRDDRNWERQRRENFDFYRDHVDARPPRTWAALRARPEGSRRGQRDDYQFAEPLKQYANRPNSGQRFQPVSAETRTQLVERRQEVRKFSQERQQLESKPREVAQNADKTVKVTREKFTKSPVVGKRAEQLSGNDAPPKRHEPKGGDLRDEKTAGRDDNGGKNADGSKKADKSDNGKRGGKDQTDKGKTPDQGQGKNKDSDTKPQGKDQADKGRNPEQGQGKNKDSDNKPQGKNQAEKGNNPDQGQGKNKDSDRKPQGKNQAENGKNPDQGRGKQTEPSTKPEKENRPRPAQNADENKGGKSDGNRMNDEPKQPKKEKSQADTNERKEPKPTQKVEQPQRQKVDQTPKHQDQPQQKQKAAPEPARQPEPKPQQKAAPERQQQPKAQQERPQQPKPQQQQQQAKPEKKQNAEKKGTKDEDPDAKKKNN